MPRKNYMTINAHETVQQMFDDFVSIKGVQKTVALNDTRAPDSNSMTA